VENSKCSSIIVAKANVDQDPEIPLFSRSGINTGPNRNDPYWTSGRQVRTDIDIQYK
jgi:hypothetical protein